MRTALLLALALAASSPAASFAQDQPKIVVLDPKGNPSWGGPIVAKSLRAKLEEVTGKPFAAKDFAKALKDLKLKGNEASEPANLAKAGKAIGADFVLVLTVTKKGWQFTANAMLINANTGEQQMDFKSGYFKPKVEGPDRGERIARVTLEKIATLRQGGALAVAPPPPPARDVAPPPPRDTTPPPPPPPARDVSPPPAPPRDTGDRIGADPTPSISGDRLEDLPPERAAPSPAPVASTAPAPSPARAPEPITEPMDGGRASDDQDIVRASVSGGAGVLHTHNIDYGDARRSTLSYQNEPLSLIVGDVEVLIPMIKSGIFAHVAFSPVRFNTAIGATGAEPTGILMDLAFGFRLHLELSGAGRQAITLAPALGLRMGLLSVAEHPANLIHGSTSIAPFAGAELRLPFAGDFEALLGVDAGLVLSYSESPANLKDGDLSGGFQMGFGAGLRYWLSDLIGIAFDGRFDMKSLSLAGPSLRQAPRGEDLVDVSIANKDLRLSVGVALRL